MIVYLLHSGWYWTTSGKEVKEVALDLSTAIQWCNDNFGWYDERKSIDGLAEGTAPQGLCQEGRDQGSPVGKSGTSGYPFNPQTGEDWEADQADHNPSPCVGADCTRSVVGYPEYAYPARR
jgi:hypothetical protein